MERQEGDSMTLDPVSVAVGVLATYAFSAVLGGVLCFAELRRARKERNEAVDQMMARVAVRCIERPTEPRVN